MPPFYSRRERRRNFYLLCDHLIALPFTCLNHRATAPSRRLRELRQQSRQQLSDICAGARPSFRPETVQSIRASRDYSPIMELVALQTPKTVLEMVRMTKTRKNPETFLPEQRVTVV